MPARCDRGRGCPCNEHERRRVYARERYDEKHRGVPRNRATGKTASSITTRSPGVTGQEPRFLEDKSGENVVIHWMPKEAEEWECPHCGKWFLKVDGVWTEPWVA